MKLQRNERRKEMMKKKEANNKYSQIVYRSTKEGRESEEINQKRIDD